MATSMIKGSPLKSMLQFALPLLVGNLLQQTYNIIDAAIVGQVLGAQALASVGASTSVQFLVLGFCMGSCTGFGIPVAKYFGAGDHKRMKDFIFNGAILTAVIAVIVTTLCAVLCPWILHMLSVQSDIYANAYIYLMIIFLGIPFTLLYNYLSSILRAVGDSRTPFIFLAFSAVLNIFLDLFFQSFSQKWDVPELPCNDRIPGDQRNSLPVRHYPAHEDLMALERNRVIKKARSQSFSRWDSDRLQFSITAYRQHGHAVRKHGLGVTMSPALPQV